LKYNTGVDFKGFHGLFASDRPLISLYNRAGGAGPVGQAEAEPIIFDQATAISTVPLKSQLPFASPIAIGQSSC